MFRTGGLFAVVGCVVLLVFPASAKAIGGGGPGAYGMLPYAWIHSGAYETDTRVLYDEETYDWTWGGPPVIGTAYALGDVQTDDSALAKASSQLNYHDPYEEGALSIGADVETWKPFVVESDTLLDGTLVDVTVEIGYDGTLQALEGVDGEYCYAFVSGELTLYDEAGSSIAYRTGDAEVECELDGGDWLFITEDFGDWDGLLTAGVDGNNDPIYSIDYVDQIDFTAEVGGKYWLYFDLATSANSSSMAPTYDFAVSETFAKADFSNTGSYSLTSPSDVNFVMVPEPASMALLAVGGLALLRRRKD